MPKSVGTSKQVSQVNEGGSLFQNEVLPVTTYSNKRSRIEVIDCNAID